MSKSPTSDLDVIRLYKPDSHHLGSIFAGMSGSGKTTAILSSLQVAIRDPRFGKKHRFVIVDPKAQSGDYDILADPIVDMDKMKESIRRERVSLFWPTDMEEMEDDVSEIVDHLFELSDRDPQTTFTFVLDEAAILITSTRVPNQLKRLSVQGRSKRIMPVFVSQRPLLNRWTDANVSNMFLFRILPVDADNLGRRWGLDFSSIDEKLRERPYSFMWFDLELAALTPMAPTPLPKIPKRAPRRRFTDFFKW